MLVAPIALPETGIIRLSTTDSSAGLSITSESIWDFVSSSCGFSETVFVIGIIFADC